MTKKELEREVQALRAELDQSQKVNLEFARKYWEEKKNREELFSDRMQAYFSNSLLRAVDNVRAYKNDILSMFNEMQRDFLLAQFDFPPEGEVRERLKSNLEIIQELLEEC